MIFHLTDFGNTPLTDHLITFFVRHQIAQQLIPFIFTSIVFIIAFAHLFRIQYATGEECYSDAPWTDSDGWLDEWRSCDISISYLKTLTMFLDAGNWAEHWSFNDSSIRLMIVFAFIVGLLLLNIVIAVLNNIFTEVQSSAEKAFWINRINTVCDINSMLNLLNSTYLGVYRLFKTKKPKKGKKSQKARLIPKAIPKSQMIDERFSFSHPPSDEVVKSLPAGIGNWWFGIEESPPNLVTRMMIFYKYAQWREIMFPDVEFESMLLGRSEVGAASSIYLFDYVRDMRNLNSKPTKVELSLFAARNISWIMFVLHMIFFALIFVLGLATFGLLWPSALKDYLFNSGLSKQDNWSTRKASVSPMTQTNDEKSREDDAQTLIVAEIKQDNILVSNELESMKREIEFTNNTIKELTATIENLLKAQTSEEPEQKG